MLLPELRTFANPLIIGTLRGVGGLNAHNKGLFKEV